MPQDSEERPYKLYRSAPRGLMARLRGQSDQELAQRMDVLEEQRAARRARRRGYGPDVDSPEYGSGGPLPGGAPGGGGPAGPPPRRRLPWLPRRRGIPGVPVPPVVRVLRVLKWIAVAVVAWVVLSLVLFFISSSKDAGNLPGGKATKNALASAGPMLFSPNTVLVVGLDSRPTSGYSSHEGGANYNEADANTDTLMLWRIGGGISRKLSIPRDTLTEVPGCGEQKINAAWSCGGPKETIQVVENLTGVKINHMVVVDLGNFVKFIDDIGGVNVKTGRICSEISGGAANGGYTLNLKPGTHHLNGTQAVTLARTRENSCNPAYTDLQREAAQQQIMNGIKSQVFSLHAFFHLPWVAWDAPGVIQTDLGPLQLMQLFISSEIGGSSKTELLKESGSYYDGEDVLVPNKENIQRQVERLINGD